jgi:hypothetical protein
MTCTEIISLFLASAQCTCTVYNRDKIYLSVHLRNKLTASALTAGFQNKINCLGLDIFISNIRDEHLFIIFFFSIIEV